MALDGSKLVLASGNKGKLRELAHMLEPLGFEVVSQADFNVEPVEETGLTFVENALLKAREAARMSGLPALGDDSGLVVDALDGRPGSIPRASPARMPPTPTTTTSCSTELDDLPMERRAAHFHCCLVLLRHEADPAPVIAEGIWHGHILEAPRGNGGFGYDPLFHDRRLSAAAAELPMEEKARVSHRGKALAKLIERLS